MSVNNSFEYFTDLSDRAMIAECGFRIAQYAADEDIGSIVLVDNAARNMHIPIRAAFRELNPDLSIPSTYFLNPAGFLSPDIHDDNHYALRKIQDECDRTGTSVRDVIDRIHSDRTSLRELYIDVQDEMELDRRTNMRERIAQKLQPLVERVVEKDDRFNDRVLIMDACSHTRGSIDGIATALRDVGIADVRTGVANNIRGHAGKRPDFVVFNDNEIEDQCKPFGTQVGLQKGLGENLVSTIAPEGLSDDAKLARRELHKIMKDGTSLRKAFLEYGQMNGFHGFPRQLIEALFGQSGGYNVASFGGGIVISSIDPIELH